MMNEKLEEKAVEHLAVIREAMNTISSEIAKIREILEKKKEK